MRIISKFHDYYDCIMREGMDLTQVWVRNEESIYCNERKPAYDGDKPTKRKKLFKWTFVKMPTVGRHAIKDGIIKKQHMIGFCGKIYPMLEYAKDSGEPQFLWNLKDVCEFYEKHLTEEQWEAFNGKKYGFMHSYYHKHYTEFFEKSKQQESSFEKLFIEFNTPVFVAVRDSRERDDRIILNAKLADLDFVKKFDPYQAYQEIQMFFGSALSGSDGHKAKYKGQMIEPNIDDITKAESKGFDKWSFRKEAKVPKKSPKGKSETKS